MKKRIARLLHELRARSAAPLWLTLALGFLGGVVFWGGFNTFMEYTNTEHFCISCHEMEKNVFVEWRETIHYANRSGVRAICSDCHVPHSWTDKVVRKVQASKELWGKITGKINTREEFVAHRRDMAEREWQRMKENDSQECRNCHDLEYMDFTEQGQRAVARHSSVLKNPDKTCIDCHKGVAHQLPDMAGVEGWQ